LQTIRTNRNARVELRQLSSGEIAERLDVVSAKFNRLVFYSGDIPHSAQISSPELLTNDPSEGRLTLNCFASLRPSPS
jgi:hypothetical protein